MFWCLTAIWEYWTLFSKIVNTGVCLHIIVQHSVESSTHRWHCKRRFQASSLICFSANILAMPVKDLNYPYHCLATLRTWSKLIATQSHNINWVRGPRCWHGPGYHQDMWDQYPVFWQIIYFPFFEILKIWIDRQIWLLVSHIQKGLWLQFCH